MRIIQLGPMPPPHGGVTTNMLAIHERLTDLGHESKIVDVTNKAGKNNAIDVLKPRSAASLLWLLTNLDFDIVHYHIGGDFTPRLALLTLFCGLLPRKKSVVTFHSGGFARDAVHTAQPFSLRGAAFRSVDRLIGVNDQMTEMFQSFGAAEGRIHLIPPFELKRPDPSVSIPADLKAALDTFSPLFLSIGALEREYAHEFLVESMPMIQGRYPNAGLLIVGSGGMETDLRRSAASRGVEEAVIFTGNLDHDIVLHLIDRADVLFRITDYDGDSISVREALFLGTPVVASDNAFRPKGVLLIRKPCSPGALLELVTKAKEAQATCQWNDGLKGGNADAVVEVYRELLEK